MLDFMYGQTVGWSEHSWYATTWQAALTAGFRVPSCSRTNTELSELYLFLACTTPSIAYAQERSQSQSQRAQITKSTACNLLVFRLPSHLIIYAHPWTERNIEEVLLSPKSHNIHFIRVASTGVIGLLPSPTYSDYVRERICWHDLSVSYKVSFLIPSVLHRWGYTSTRLLHLPRIPSYSSWSTTYLPQGYGG